MFTKATVATLFASLAAAQLHAPTTLLVSGNSITRPLNEVVPACKPFEITWTPTTPNTVSMLLVKGPSNNVVKFGPALAEGIPNSGKLTWTPAADLPTTEGNTGYGLQIIDDVTGQYQWSTQFGISKGENCVVASSSAVSSGYPASTMTPPKSTGTGYSTANGTTTASHSTASGYPTGAPAHNTTVVQPTKSMSVPSTLKPTSSGTATTSRLPEATANAASAVQAGLGLAFAGVVALML